MSTEPLWRGKTDDWPEWGLGPGTSVLSVPTQVVDAPGGTEVEVWRAGDRTPTRERVLAVVISAFVEKGEPFSHGQANLITNTVMALLSGVPTEADATDD